jgi:hypothetical protein
MKCSPSGDQRSNVVSAASILAISFRADVSHSSTFPWILPNPPRIKSNSVKETHFKEKKVKFWLTNSIFCYFIKLQPLKRERKC